MIKFQFIFSNNLSLDKFLPLLKGQRLWSQVTHFAVGKSLFEMKLYMKIIVNGIPLSLRDLNYGELRSRNVNMENFP